MSKQLLRVVKRMQSDIKYLKAAGLRSNASHLENILAIVLYQAAAANGSI